MSDRVEKKTATVGLIVAAPGLVLAFIFAWYLWSSSRVLQMERTKALPTHIPAAGIMDLIIARSGQLLAVYQAPTYVDVFKWDLRYQSSKTSVDFTQLVGTKDFELLPPFAAGSGNAAKSPAVPAKGLPYAISDDGTMIVSSWQGRLFAGPLEKPGRYQRQLDPPTPVVALSFLRENLVGVLHEGGEFRLEKFPQPAPNFAGTELRGPWKISGRGPFRILSRFDAKNGLLLNPTGRTVYQGFPTSPSGTFITASPMGRIVMGTNDGKVIFPQPFGKSPSVQLPERKAVQLLAFYDEENLIAGVQGGRLYLVEAASRATPLGAALTDARLLAVRGGRMAMVTSDSIVMASLKQQFVLSEYNKWLLALTFSLLSVFAFFRLIATDSTKLILLCREGRTLPPASAPSPPKPREERSDEPET